MALHGQEIATTSGRDLLPGGSSSSKEIPLSPELLGVRTEMMGSLGLLPTVCICIWRGGQELCFFPFKGFTFSGSRLDYHQLNL